MKKKLFIIIAVCLVTAIALVAVLALRGCGDQTDESSTDVSVNTEVSDTVSNTEASEEISYPETSTDTVLNVPKVKQLLEEVIVQETFVGDDLPLSSQYANAVVNSMTYEILNITQHSTAIVKFEYVDVLKMADEYTGSAEDADAFYRYCIEIIENDTAPTIINEVEVIVEFNESDGTYDVVSSIELADALTGGIASEYLDILNGRS